MLSKPMIQLYLDFGLRKCTITRYLTVSSEFQKQKHFFQKNLDFDIIDFDRD